MKFHREISRSEISHPSAIANKQQEKRPGLYSNNFNNNHWCLAVWPKSCFKKETRMAVGAVLAKWPIFASAIDVSYTITLQFASGKIHGGDKKQSKLKWIEWDSNTHETYNVLKQMVNLNCSEIEENKWLNEEWININVEIDITNIYVGDKVIEKEKWNDYGIV